MPSPGATTLMRRRVTTAIAASLTIACLLLLLTRAARAHDVGVSLGNYALQGNTVQAELSFGDRDFVELARALGFSESWLSENQSQEIGSAILEEGVDVRDASAKRCPSKLSEAVIEEDALKVVGTFQCAAELDKAVITLPLMAKLPSGHRHVVELGEGKQALLTREAPRFELSKAGASYTGPVGFSGFLVSGVEHILFGFDHLVFLFGLVLVGRRFKGVFWAITAFTLAHSVTLGLAVLKIWAPSGAIIEPLIALSVAYVGVENFFVRDADKRWRITLPFGLVHGFGFAGALGEINLPAAQIPPALLAFNLGVEVGQLAVLAPLLPLLLYLHRQPWFEKGDRVVRVLSVAIVIIGLYWFLTRVLALL